MKIFWFQMKKHVAPCFKSNGYKQIVKELTRDSGTLIDHIYATNELHLTADVYDCYYSDHDYVLCTMIK